MIKVGHKPYSSVSTDGHPVHRKESTPSEPPTPITKEEYKIAYSFLEDDVEAVAALLEMRLQSQLYQAFKENPENNLSIWIEGVLNGATKVGMFTCDLISDTVKGENHSKHKHPHWHKNRW